MAEMKHFLVVRDEKSRNLEVLQFDDLQAAKKEKDVRQAQGHNGELVICFGQSLESFFKTFTEYRPDNWRELINKK